MGSVLNYVSNASLERDPEQLKIGDSSQNHFSLEKTLREKII